MLARTKEPSLHLLHIIETCGGILAAADNLVAIARLIDAGWAVAEDDYEGPRVICTPKGTRAMDRAWKRKSK